ncbi:MAG: hypothetical protein J0M26_15120, partial [Planctomycetes bacterium]|nr:hypothetical protein [Planctomycetota bacterium]
RTRRNVGAATEDFEELDLANDTAVDINRFAGLGDEWFTTEEWEWPTNSKRPTASGRPTGQW